MIQLIVLDSGPLGLLTHPRPSSAAIACTRWMKKAIGQNIRVLLPAIVDYELRREYLRRENYVSLQKLDALRTALEWLVLEEAALKQAARLWAQTHQTGRPLADAKALDADCILVAQVRSFAESNGIAENEFVIATSDVGDLPFLAPARRWEEIQL